MRKFEPVTGGHPLRLDDLMQVQLAFTEAFTGVASAFNNGNDYVITGCKVTSTISTLSVSPGYVFHAGEVFRFPGGSVPAALLIGYGFYLDVLQVTQNPVTLVSPYTVTYQSTGVQSVHFNRTLQLVVAMTGDIPLFSLTRVTNTLVSGGTLPLGAVTLWSGIFNSTSFVTSSPSSPNYGLGVGNLNGWALCNGKNGTVDLRGRFVVGLDPASNSGLGVNPGDYSTQGNVGGEAQHLLLSTESGMVGHNHTLTDPGHNHEYTASQGGGVNNAPTPTTSNLASDQALFTANSTTGISIAAVPSANAANPHENRPPYYTLAYIQRIA